MAFSITQLPLFVDPYYRYSIALEDQQRFMNFYWNEREGHWMFDLYNSSNVPVLLGQKLVADYQIAADYDLSGYGITGYFLVSPNNAESKLDVGDKNTLATRFTLFYIYETGE